MVCVMVVLAYMTACVSVNDTESFSAVQLWQLACNTSHVVASIRDNNRLHLSAELVKYVCSELEKNHGF